MNEEEKKAFLKQLADTALGLQDASNPIAVAGKLGQIAVDLRKAGFDSDGIARHPIMMVVMDKLASMGMYVQADEHSKIYNAYHDVGVLAGIPQPGDPV